MGPSGRIAVASPDPAARGRRLLARYYAHRAALQAARAQTAPHPPDREIIREHLIRALERTAIYCVLAAVVLAAPPEWVEAAHWWLRVAWVAL